MRGIIENELTGRNWKGTWDNETKTHPEARSPEYDLVVNTKPYFLYNASVRNPHNNSKKFSPKTHSTAQISYGWTLDMARESRETSPPITNGIQAFQKTKSL